MAVFPSKAGRCSTSSPADAHDHEEGFHAVDIKDPSNDSNSTGDSNGSWDCVACKEGRVLIFEQGDKEQWGLLHEGQELRKGGHKQCVRTDVLYELVVPSEKTEK